MKVRPIGHDDRLSIIDHLDELRSRIWVCVLVLFVAFGVGFWQNAALLRVLNRALPPSAKTGIGDQSRQNAAIHHGFVGIGNAAKSLGDAAQAMLSACLQIKPGGPALCRSANAMATAAERLAAAAHSTAKALPAAPPAQEKLITIGVSESFTTTLMVVGYFALMVTIPVLLYQLYAFVIPALSRSERRLAIPIMLAAPALFLIGVVFTYFAILPPAIHFLQGYNSEHFIVLTQAKSYYKFEILLLLGVGVVFEVPLLLLALQKVGLITARTLTVNWRYAAVIIAIIAAALPGVDPVTMALETAPLIALYLVSILLLHIVEYRSKRRQLV